MDHDLFRIVFDDGKIRILVATDLTHDECEDLIKKQLSPELYHIIDMDRKPKEN